MTSDKAQTERLQRIHGVKDNEELRTEYDEWASEYDADLEALGFLSPKAAAELLDKHLSDKAARVLDAGAGTGMVGVELARRDFTRITALDMSQGMLDTAKEKGVYEDFVIGELGKPLPFETDGFAGTTCVGVFTYAHATPEALDELVRATKSGGPVVFSIRTDYYTDAGFDVKQAALEADGKWRLLERSAPFRPMPNGEPDVWHEMWAYEVL